MATVGPSGRMATDTITMTQRSEGCAIERSADQTLPLRYCTERGMWNDFLRWIRAAPLLGGSRPGRRRYLKVLAPKSSG